MWNHQWNPDTLGTAYFGPNTGEYSAHINECAKPWPQPSGPFHFAGSERARRGVQVVFALLALLLLRAPLQWMEGAVLMGNKKGFELLQTLYPAVFTPDEKKAYKADLSQKLNAGLAVLQRQPGFSLSYLVELFFRFLWGELGNLWDEIFNHQACASWRSAVAHASDHADPAPPRPAGASDRLSTRGVHVLEKGHFIYSPNGQFRFGLVREGDAVLELLQQGKANVSVWESGMHSEAGTFTLELSDRGELAVFVTKSDNSKHVVWRSHTAVPEAEKRSYYELHVKDDRNVMLYAYDADSTRYVIWSTHTWDPYFADHNKVTELHTMHADVDALKPLVAHISEKKHPFRAPRAGTMEEAIYNEAVCQHAKEKPYARQALAAPVNAEHPDRLGSNERSRGEGTVLRDSTAKYTLDLTKEGELCLIEHHTLHANRKLWSSVAADQHAPGVHADQTYCLNVRSDGASMCVSAC